MANDDYEPAITETASDAPGAESTLETRSEAAASAPVLQAGEAGDDPTKPPGAEPRGQRVISDRTRAMFKAIAESAAKAEAADPAGVADDLVPMTADDPPPASAAPAAVAPPPIAAVTPPAVAAVAPAVQPVALPDVGKAAAEQARLLAEASAQRREAEFTAREAAISEREKLLPTNADLIERPGATLAAMLRQAYGGVEGDELRDILTDVVTELSETGLGVKLPAEVKTAMETRKALRSVKSYKADLTRQQKSLAEQRAAQDKAVTEAREAAETAQREVQATRQVSQLLADPAQRAELRFLHDSELTGVADPAGIVIEVIKEQIAAGQKADWQSAARYANDYFKSQAEAAAKKAAHLQTLLAPATHVAVPAKAATPPGGLPGPSPKTQQPPTPQATSVDAPESSEDSAVDRRDRRAAQLRALSRKHKVMTAP